MKKLTLAIICVVAFAALILLPGYSQDSGFPYGWTPANQISDSLDRFVDSARTHALLDSLGGSRDSLRGIDTTRTHALLDSLGSSRDSLRNLDTTRFHALLDSAGGSRDSLRNLDTTRTHALLDSLGSSRDSLRNLDTTRVHALLDSLGSSKDSIRSIDTLAAGTLAQDEVITGDWSIGNATPKLSWYDTDSENGASVDTSGIVAEADGTPSISLYGTDGDVWGITLNTSDEAVFENAAEYQFDQNIDIASGKVYEINNAQITSDALSDVASIAMLDEAETITNDWAIGNATPQISLYDSDSETGVALDTTALVVESDGAPSAILYGTDGDAWGLTINTSDQASFEGASGGYIFDSDIIFPDPGTSANSKSLILRADNTGTVQEGQIEVMYGADPYLRLSAPNDAGTATAIVDLKDQRVVIGAGTAGVDYDLFLNGETNDGTITYMEDEDRFDFDNDVDVIADLTAGTISSDAAITVATSLLPDADNGADIGTSGTEFDSLFVDDIVVSGSASIAGFIDSIRTRALLDSAGGSVDSLLALKQDSTDAATRTFSFASFQPQGDSAVWVSSNGTYTTIAAAEAVADSGEAIVIGRGVYAEEGITVDGTHLMGEIRGNTAQIITGTDTLLTITKSGTYISNLTFIGSGSGNLIVIEDEVSVTFEKCIFVGDRFALSPDNSGAQITYINCKFYPTDVPSATTGFSLLGDDWVWFIGSDTKFGEPTGGELPSYVGADSTYGLYIAGYGSMLSGGGIYSARECLNIVSGNFSAYGELKIYAADTLSSAVIQSGGAANFYGGNGQIIKNQTEAVDGGANTYQLTGDGTVRFYGTVVDNKGDDSSYVSTSTGASELYNQIFLGKSKNGGNDIAPFLTFQSGANLTNPEVLVNRNLRIGARGRPYSFYACGADTFNGADQYSTVDYTGILFDTTAPIDTVVVINAVASGPPVAAPLSGDAIVYIYQTAADQFIVIRLGATNTANLPFTWSVTQYKP